MKRVVYSDVREGGGEGGREGGEAGVERIVFIFNVL